MKKKKIIFVHTKKKPFMRFNYSVIFVFIFSFYMLNAQEDPRVTLFPWMISNYNPGAMGEKDQNLNFTGLLRQHSFLMKAENNINTSNLGENNTTDNSKPTYDKIDGQQIFLNIDSYFKQIKGAVGITFLKDKNGYNDNIGFKFGYSARLPIRGGKLGIGIQFCFLNQKPSTDKYRPNQMDDPIITNAKQSESFLDFDLSFGLHYKAPTWYAGISGTQLIGGVRVSGAENFMRPARQLYVTGGYIWNLKTSVPWSIEPGVLLRSNFKTWTMDVMALARYNGILWFGLSYQLEYSVALLFGAVPFYNNTNVYLKGLEIGISYSFVTAKYVYKPSGSFGDFEVLIRYGFNFYKDKPLTGYGSSRHLYKNQY
ncbi:MAG: type IX secretion system membrane protein PorP/SprF [Bacteroidales bacterium]|nr:type IX secretion system membrane protein PorP/SprF [Bacteroidales bacterium]